jgi:hypothetical protein
MNDDTQNQNEQEQSESKQPQPWHHDAPLNPEFRGAQRPRLGEDY